MYWRTNTYLLVEWTPLDTVPKASRSEEYQECAAGCMVPTRRFQRWSTTSKLFHTGWLLARRPVFFGPGQPIEIRASFNNGTMGPSAFAPRFDVGVPTLKVSLHAVRLTQSL
jgi:hypothetical protein